MHGSLHPVRHVVLAGLALLAAVVPPSRGEGPADLVLVGGTVRTLDGEGRIASGLAVRAGRIEALGSRRELAPRIGPETIVVELDGATVLPGFHDLHVHPYLGGLWRAGCWLGEADTREEALTAIRDCVAKEPGRGWIVGSGWELTLFPESPPHKEPLDRIAPDRPLYLRSADGHTAWVSSRALALAGIDRDTPDPPGGRIERDARTGEPTGCLREEAKTPVEALLPPPDRSRRLAALRAGLEVARRAGITSLLDAKVDSSLLATYRELDRGEGLGMRVTAALLVDPTRGAEQVAGLVAERDAAASSWLRPDVAKIFLDGVIESGTAALLAPYTSRWPGRGELRIAPERLAELADALDAAGFDLHFHAIGDRAVRVALDRIAALAAARARERHPHLAHLELVDPADLPRFRALGVTAIFQPLWAYSEEYVTELTEPVLGPERSRRLYPLGGATRAGAPLAAGSDWPVSSLDPLAAIEVAVTRRAPDAPPGPPWLPDQRLSPAQALAAYTTEGARALRQEALTGTLEPGKAADLVVLDRDPIAVPPTEISDIEVLAVYLAGRHVAP